MMVSSATSVSIRALATATAFALPAAAMAQGEPADAQEVAAADDDLSGNVIIVTARSRAENIQDVPLAITAFTEENLERQGIQNLDDVARFTPGFSFESFSGGFALPVIRGQAQSRVTALETNVSTFIDGIYIPRSWAVDLGTANIARIEVVKGPQSARYGRNAFAGAINYVPRKASLSEGVGGEVSTTVGIDERFDFGFFANLPLNDRLAIAIAYDHSSYDGSWENAHPFADLGLDPGTDGNVGGWNNNNIFVSAAFEVFDGFTVEASLNRSDVENEARASRYIGDSVGGILDPDSVSPTNTGLTAITNCGATRFFSFSPLICGELPDPGDEVIVDPRGFGTFAETDIIRVGATWDISDALTLAYTFGNINGEVDIGTSGEPDPINCGTLVGPSGGFAPLCNFQVTPVGDIDYDSHELRLSFESGPIRGAVGGFYSEGTDNNRFTSVNIAPVTGPDIVPLVGTPVPSFNFNPGPFNILLGDVTTDTEVTAIFGELQYSLPNDATRIAVEARYSETEITALDNRRALGATNPLSDTFKEFAPRVTIEHDVNPDVLVFATAAKGTKAGGFNAGAFQQVDRTFDPEENWTYELGVKSQLANGNLLFNASVFYTDWSDIQINSADIDPTDPDNPNVPSITRNLGNAELYGIELAAQFQATENLSLDATFSHNEGTYADDTVDSRFSRGVPGLTAPCDDIVCSTDGNIGGNEIERAASTQASGGIQWEADMGDDSSYFIRADASWQSEFFADSANLAIIPSRFLVNGSAGVQFGDISLRVWGRNIFDKKFTSNAFVVLLPFGNTYGQFFGERRSVGVTAEIDF